MEISIKKELSDMYDIHTFFLTAGIKGCKKEMVNVYKNNLELPFSELILNVCDKVGESA
jgi:hypothetical protein